MSLTGGSISFFTLPLSHCLKLEVMAKVLAALWDHVNKGCTLGILEQRAGSGRPLVTLALGYSILTTECFLLNFSQEKKYHVCLNNFKFRFAVMYKQI